MELTVKSRNGKVTERQRQHIDEKLNKLARYMDGINSATVEVLSEQLRSTGETYRLVNEMLLLTSNEVGTDLWSLDALWWAAEKEHDPTRHFVATRWCTRYSVRWPIAKSPRLSTR